MSDSTECSAYFYRSITLVVEVGTGTLRELFYLKHPKATVATFFSKPKILSEFSKLKSKKVLTAVQYQNVTCNPDPEKYDISLLITLLTNKKIYGISEPTTGWGKLPPDTDLSLGADLLRVRDFRNQIVGHRSNIQLEEEEFQELWGSIGTILVRIASQVNSTVEADVQQKIENARTRLLEPLDDREKKLLKVFLESQKEDAEKYQAQLTDVLESLSNLHLKVDSKKTIHSTDETDAARSDDSLISLQTQVENIAQNIGNMAQQGALQEIHQNVQSMQGDMNVMRQTIEMLMKQLEDSKHQTGMLTQQLQAAGQQPAIVSHDGGGYSTTGNVVSLNKKRKVINPYAMEEKEILHLSKQIGYEWEQLRIHLDFTEPQAHALKRAYEDDVQQRIHQMLKSWHDVVVDCGENPRMLLAAAFVNASTNYAMAYKLVPREQFKANAEAKPATVDRIHEIIFSRRGYDQGDGFYYRPGSGSAMSHGGPGSINVYGGTFTVGGAVAIHSSPSNLSSNSIASDGVDSGGTVGMPSGSFNVIGGNVAMGSGSSLVIGPPAQSYLSQNNPALNYNPQVFRGETQAVPDSGTSSMGSFQSVGQPFKKEHDDTLSQAMVLALHEQMKSVGVLISSGNLVGTVFRVGSKYVMTAWHVINKIIDPSKTGTRDVTLLESTETYINFNESPLTPPMVPYRMKRDFIFNVDLDVAVLEISNPSNLPMKLNLCKTECGVTNVSLVGYGHPGQIKKCLDPKCEIIYSNSHRVLSAQAWLQQNLGYFKSAIQGIGRNPSLVDKGYQGYDQSSKLIFDCYMEHGASGAPALTNDNERSVRVVGMLTHGLPDFYFSLPELIKPQFRKEYRFEVAAKMKDIFNWINSESSDVAKDLFN